MSLESRVRRDEPWSACLVTRTGPGQNKSTDRRGDAAEPGQDPDKNKSTDRCGDAVEPGQDPDKNKSTDRRGDAVEPGRDPYGIALSFCASYSEKQ